MNGQIPSRISGKVYVLGDDIDTDVIIPARYLTTMDANELKKHAMEDLDPKQYPIPFLNADKSCNFQIIVAGKNFGCGSSREHAPIALNAAGIQAVVASSFARIYYRNSVNGGRLILPLESKQDISKELKTGDEVKISLDSHKLKNVQTGKEFEFKPFGPVKEILEAGGLTSYNKQKLGLK
ncbi:MAG: 3-isopropylmalate dehydratase [Candidatus Diapherotrites archaeon]